MLTSISWNVSNLVPSNSLASAILVSPGVTVTTVCHSWYLESDLIMYLTSDHHRVEGLPDVGGAFGIGQGHQLGHFSRELFCGSPDDPEEEKTIIFLAFV